MMSLAFAGPTRRVSRCVPPAPGMMPSRISGWPILALSEMTRKSAHIDSSQPPPSAKPVTAAMTGFGMRATVWKHSCRTTARASMST